MPPQLRREEVDDDRTIVQQYPAGILSALLVPSANTVLTQLFAQRLDQRTHVPRVHGGGDDEVVGKRGHPVNVQQDDLLRLAVGQKINNAAGNVSRLCQRPLLTKRSVLWE